MINNDRIRNMIDKNALQNSIEWVKGSSKGVMGTPLDHLTIEAIQIVEAHEGFLRCNFIVPFHLLDNDGNWHTGAIAALIDCLGGITIYSFTGNLKASLDLSISFYSTVKQQEEVEVLAKVVGKKGKLASAEVKIRRKDNRQLVASGRLWISSSIQESKL
ncbi:uncharacterized protein LOC123215651 [Mangifera indica]|uniref:uncharacterized protein LOC123215651 n=1 Tax=Mangifera indica TaxID=29780 RepID=UPI001CFA3BDC|nr:uncharacterized protein LOC123215651 [Mangifera indica]